MTSWLPEDVEGLLEIHTDPETMRFIRHGRPESREETERLVDQYIEEEQQTGWTKWRVVDTDGVLVGRAGFGHHPAGRQLAFTIRRSHQGRGLAQEVATALVDWHLVNAPEVSLRALAAVGNRRSVTVLRKAGFLEVGTEVFADTTCHSFIHPLTA